MKATNKITRDTKTNTLAPQNHRLNVIQPEVKANFLPKTTKGAINKIIITTKDAFNPEVCSWGAREATLIRKISNPPIKTIT